MFVQYTGVVQYNEDVQYTGGYHEYNGGYHEYTGRGGGVFSTLKKRVDIITLHNVCAVHRGVCSTMGDVQYTGGYHEYTLVIS